MIATGGPRGLSSFVPLAICLLVACRSCASPWKTRSDNDRTLACCVIGFWILSVNLLLSTTPHELPFQLQLLARVLVWIPVLPAILDMLYRVSRRIIGRLVNTVPAGTG